MPSVVPGHWVSTIRKDSAKELVFYINKGTVNHRNIFASVFEPSDN
jgi:hypothetical protein